MNLNKLIAAVLSLSFVAGATTNINNYAPHYSVKANAEGDTAIVTTTAATTTTVTTTKAVATTTTKADVTTVSTTKAAATTTKAAVTTTVKAPVISTTAAVTTTAKSATSTTSVVTSITSSTTTPVAKDIISGDVNNDGRIDAIDASTILSHYALISTNQKGILTEAQLKSADINNDGIVNAIDASTVLAIYAANSVKAVKPSVQNNPIHDFSLKYDIDLSSPTWIYIDPKKNESYFKPITNDCKNIKNFFPSEERLKELFKSDVLSDYRCVATVYNSKGGYGNDLHHIFVDNDITELKVEWSNNEKSGLQLNKNAFRVLTNQNTAREWMFLGNLNGSYVVNAYSAIYSNIPIVFEDGTVLQPHKEVQLKKLKNVQITKELGTKAVTFDNYSSFSKTFTVPDWYGIDLRNPTWEYYDEDPKTKKKTFYCDRFGGDFKMEEAFPSDELLNNALSLKVGGRDNYECVASIVHNNRQSRGGGYRTVELEHVFVKKNVDELKGRWSNKEKTGITFTNLEYVCKNQHTRCSDIESGWTNPDSCGLGVGDAIYTNVPIIINDVYNKELDTVIEPYFLYGDINDDGVIDIEDARMIVDFLNGDIELPDDRARKAADVNRDGVIDEKDITDSEDHINGKKPINDSNIINNDNDSDSDGLTDLEEYVLKTNRFNPDTDGDGLKDGEEVKNNTNPLVTDTDGDGVSDGIDSDKLTPNIPKEKAPYGQIKFEDEYYRIDVPSFLEGEFFEPNCYEYKTVSFTDTDRHILEYFIGSELNVTQPSNPSDKGYTFVDDQGNFITKDRLNLEECNSIASGGFYIIDCIHNMIKGSFTRIDIDFVFYKTKSNEPYKVCIYAKSSDARQLYDKYASDIPHSWSTTQGDIRFYSIVDSNCEQLYRDLTKKEPDTDYFYDLVVSVDKNHKGTSAFAYLWINANGNVMATPCTYGNDYVKLVRSKDDWGIFDEDVLYVPLSDTINLEQSFEELFDRIHEYS